MTSIFSLTQWTLTAHGPRVPDRVRGTALVGHAPGSVTTDLLSQGLIDDPYVDDHENLQKWIGESDWHYSTVLDLDVETHAHWTLRFSGVDTVADITVGAVPVAHSENMHRSFDVEITEALAAGERELGVRILSPVREADRRSLEIGYRPHVNWHPYNALRKMACSFGWDWGIDAASSGLWKGVALLGWDSVRVRSTSWRAQVAPDGIGGRVDVSVELQWDHGATEPVAAVLTCAGTNSHVFVKPGTKRLDMSVNVSRVERWWPVGLGDPTLYEASLVIDTKDLHHEESRRLGFRTVALDITPDDQGTGMLFAVNETPVHVRGVNWIPDDAFPHVVDAPRYRERLTQALRAHCNLVRVWGGGIYESEEFYSTCDELGLLTWQDFLLACASYSEEEPLRSEFEAETREAVARLSSHPSLIVFNGANENLQGFEEWGWKNRLEGKSWGLGYYTQTFPRIVAELAPQVLYTPGSPFSPTPGTAANDPNHGSTHLWETWNRQDYPVFRSYRPRFVAEFGWQGPATWTTLTDSVTDRPLTPESPGMLVHQKAQDGNDKLTDGSVLHLPYHNDMEAWHWSMQINQAHAVAYAIEWFRSLSPHCTGQIVWQLNDSWPVTSWAAIDHAGREKPLYHAIAHSYEPHLLTVQPRDGRPTAVLVNDLADEWITPLTVERRDLGGATLARWTTTSTAQPFSHTDIALPDEIVHAHDLADEILVVTAGTRRASWCFSEYKDMKLRVPRRSVLVSRAPEASTWWVDITSDTVEVSMALLIDKVDPDAHVDTLAGVVLPGEVQRFCVTSASELRAADLTRPGVVVSVNDLVTEDALHAHTVPETAQEVSR